MSKKGNARHQGAADNRGASTTHREAHPLGGDGEHVSDVSHANVDHAHAGHDRKDGDEIAKHRDAHFGMSPAPLKSVKLSPPTKPVKTSKHARQ
jgi:hypothetical protein